MDFQTNINSNCESALLPFCLNNHFIKFPSNKCFLTVIRLLSTCASFSDSFLCVSALAYMMSVHLTCAWCHRDHKLELH